MDETKTLTLSNGEMAFEYECTKTIHTKVSEEVLRQSKIKNKVDVKQVVTDVIVNELGLGDGDWQLSE
jgi:hypothetical protein